LDHTGIDELLAESGRADARISTPLSTAFLRWRYAAAPLLNYRAVIRGSDGRLDGVAFFRIRPRGRLVEATVADVLVRQGDVRSARTLLREITDRSVDHLAWSFPTGWTAAHATRAMPSLRAPAGIRFVANDLDHTLGLDVFDLRSWGLPLADLEVF
jgi:hypothetical protein